jgi:heme/copper-type cytochrome/quinol oxidase subunit 2
MPDGFYWAMAILFFTLGVLVYAVWVCWDFEERMKK